MKRMITTLTAALVLVTVIYPRASLGVERDLLWPETEVPSSRSQFQHIPDGDGGTIIAHVAGTGGVYASRYDAFGTLLWGPVLLSAAGADASLPRLCSYGSANALVAWVQEVSTGVGQVHVNLVSGSGTTPWAAPVAASNPLSLLDALAVAPGHRSIFLVYRADVALYAAHVNVSGVVAGPGLAGLSLGTARSFAMEPSAVPDGSSGTGIIAAWADVTKNIVAQNVILSSGILSSDWGGGSPVTICTTPGDGFHPSAAQDGAGGALISWTEINLFSTKTEIRAQRVDSSGSSQWTANGVVLVDSSVVGGSTLWQYGETSSAIAPGGAGGAYIAWNDWRNDTGGGNDDIFAQRVNASGVAQWASGGISLPHYLPGSQRAPRMVSDLDGGALVVFQDKGGWSWDISLVKLAPAGKEWFQWVFWDSQSSSDPGEDQLEPEVVYDGSGPIPKGCIVVWREQSSSTFAQKVQIGSGSLPTGNLARDGTGIMGTQDDSGVDTPLFHMGASTNINDGNWATRVDTWNDLGTDKLSFVGISWAQPQPYPVHRLQLTLATFGDGGWFGPNNQYPGPGNPLTPALLTEPAIQVTDNGGVTWANVAHTSDYLTALDGHGIGGGTNPNPSSVSATFVLNPAISNINGIRIIGSEGGIASGGFLGVFELAIYAQTVQPVHLLNPVVQSGQFQFEFDSKAGKTHVVHYKSPITGASWQTLTTIIGDGTRKVVTDNLGANPHFYRVSTE